MPKGTRVDPLIRELQKRRDQLASEIQGIDQAISALGKSRAAAPSSPGRKKAVRGQRKMSAAGRAAISRAAKKRWAAFRKAGKD